MVEKEKDLAYLKFNLHELKKCFNQKKGEVESLKVKYIEIEKEAKSMKELNQELNDQHNKEIEVLKSKNQSIECKVDLLESKLLESNHKADDQPKVISLYTQVDELKSNLDEKICSLEKQT